jgi:hypothetical protein
LNILQDFNNLIMAASNEAAELGVATFVVGIAEDPAAGLVVDPATAASLEAAYFYQQQQFPWSYDPMASSPSFSPHAQFFLPPQTDAFFCY